MTQQVWQLPKPMSTHDVSLDEDTTVTLRRHGNPSGPRLVLSHGNGLAIDLYYPFWALLADDYDLIIYDLRNHGWNAANSAQNHNLPTLIRDHDVLMAAIDRHFGDKPRVGIFHSVSALATLLSPNDGADFAARILFDPPAVQGGQGPSRV